MTRHTLECAVLALIALTVHLIRVVTTIVLMIALPTRRDTLAIGAVEFRFGTFAIFTLANGVILITAITAIIREVAHPLFWYAAIVGALKVSLAGAFWTVLWQLIAIVATIVFAIAEEPFWYAAIVGLARTALPAGGAVTLTTHIRRLIGVITTVIVEVTHPQLRYAAAVLAAELRLRIASAFVTHSRILVAAILTVCIAITTPAVQYATSARLTFEVRFGAGQIAVLFIATIAAIVGAITDRCRGCAIRILTLECASAAVTCRTSCGFIGTILTILFPVTLPEPGYTFLVVSATAVLTGGAVGYASFTVACQIELIGAGAFVARGALLDVALNIKVSGLWWWRN